MIPILFQPSEINTFEDIFITYKSTLNVGFIDHKNEQTQTINLSSTQRALSRSALLGRDVIACHCDSFLKDEFKKSIFGRKELSELDYSKVAIFGDNTVTLWNPQIYDFLNLIVHKAKYIYINDSTFSKFVLSCVDRSENSPNMTICYSGQDPKITHSKGFHLQITKYDIERFNENEFLNKRKVK